MHLHTRNVNDAFRGLVAGIHDGSLPTEKRPSRNGNVIQIAEPVLITYQKPKERVLFNQARDASPWFHIFESLWMLAGRNDVASVAYYAKQMKEYSDDGKTLNGAYGYRWRSAHTTSDTIAYDSNPIDQLNVLVNHLKADPSSRRAVLQMWNVEDDLLKIGKPCLSCETVGKGPRANCPWCEGTGKQEASKDVCCNLSVMFSLRHVDDGTMSFRESSPLVPIPGTEKIGRHYLDMTVTNRSNDLVWGLLGANYVHFTFLQEYMAARLGVEVGKYHHFTNNLHAYEWNWKPKEWLEDKTLDDYTVGTPTKTVPLVKDWANFDTEVVEFVRDHDGSNPAHELEDRWSEPFLSTVAGPMLTAFACHKEGSDHCALQAMAKVEADDWRIAGENWLKRRIKK